VCAAAAVVAVGVSVPAVGAAGDPFAESVTGLVDDGFPGVIGYARTTAGERFAVAGVADRERPDEPPRRWDRFRIASNTKAFTATVVLQLVGEGRLGLDDPVAPLLPDVALDPAITVRQLLNHTSGLYDPTNERDFWKPYLDDHDWDYVYRPRDIVATAVAHPLTGPPGGGYDYSNTNYLVAGMLIEAVTGHRAEDEVRWRIVDALGLSQTEFPTTDPRIHGPHLHGYDLAGEDISVFSPSYDWTAGAIVSTVDDLAEFHRALFDGTLLAPAELAELKRTVPVGPGTSYGLGVERKELPCPNGTVVPMWGNTGAGPGYSTFSLVTEDTRRQLVLAMNTFDIADELSGGSGTPAANPMPALQTTFC
jgi:D-alanyl-D-alanine carboxypeptidase